MDLNSKDVAGQMRSNQCEQQETISMLFPDKPYYIPPNHVTELQCVWISEPYAGSKKYNRRERIL